MAAPPAPVVEQSSENTGERSVLICFGDRSRPVTFSSGSGSDKARLLSAANAVFEGITPFDGHSLVQVKSEMWQGEFVDVDDSDTIPHKAIVRVVQSVSIQ